jgi:peptidoglycan/LPS O-acetylase OafA/YrhL
MSLWTVDWFRRRFDQVRTVVRRAGRGSFVAYLVHAPVTIVLAAGLRDVDVAAELKFVVVFALTVVVSFALGWPATRTPSSGHIL